MRPLSQLVEREPRKDEQTRAMHDVSAYLALVDCDSNGELDGDKIVPDTIRLAYRCLEACHKK